VHVKNGTIWLGTGIFVSGAGKVSKAAAVANGATVTLRLEIVYAAGQAKVARVYLGGVLQLSYTLTADGGAGCLTLVGASRCDE
jgi:hypothetical protein